MYANTAGLHDLARLRADTPGTARLAHFNNAGSSLPVAAVVEAQNAYLSKEALRGGYEALEHSRDDIQRAYNGLAQLLHCDSDEIAIVQSATTAWTQVFYGIPFKKGDRILTSVIEYGANYIAFLQMVKRAGVVIEVIPETGNGDISISDLERMIEEGERRPALIAITHVPTSSGRVYDAAAVGRVARRAGIPYLLDACQSVGHMPLDVRELGCDWLTGTGRKYLRGPRGTGFLYASREAMARFEPAAIDNSGALWTARSEYQLVPGAKRYEMYEKSFAAVVGLGVALDYLLALGQDWVWQRVQTLAGELRSQLAGVPGVTLLDRGRTLCGLVSFTLDGIDCNAVKSHLAEQNISVWVSPASSTRIDFEARQLSEVAKLLRSGGSCD